MDLLERELDLKREAIEDKLEQNSDEDDETSVKNTMIDREELHNKIL